MDACRRFGDAVRAMQPGDRDRAIATLESQCSAGVEAACRLGDRMKLAGVTINP